MAFFPFLITAALGAGTYAAEGNPSLAAIKDGGKSIGCYRMEAGQALTVEGPANVRLQLWIDVPAGAKKPQSAQLVIGLDGVKKTHKLTAKPTKKTTYEPALDVVPGKAGRAIPLKIPKGGHRIEVALGGGTGCLQIEGVKLSAPLAPPPVAVAEPPVSPEPPPQVAPTPTPAAAPSPPSPPAAVSTTTTATSAVTGSGVEETTQKENLALISVPTASEPAHEIKATEVGEIKTEVTPEAATITISDRHDLIRLGPYLGGVLPTGDLKPTMAIGLIVEAPMPFRLPVPGLELAVYGAGGWTPMRQQQRTMVPGRGLGNVIQNSLVLPFDVGARGRLNLGLPIHPYASLALAIDISRSSIKAFSTPAVQENDVAFGVAAAAGIWVPLGPGGIMAELRYREASADLGAVKAIAEERLANGSLQVAYLLGF